eukprot:180285-Hanusia_phi.AAC.1
MQQTEKYLKYSHLLVADGLWNEDLWFHCSSLYYDCQCKFQTQNIRSLVQCDSASNAAVCGKA